MSRPETLSRRERTPDRSPGEREYGGTMSGPAPAARDRRGSASSPPLSGRRDRLPSLTGKSK